MKGDLDRAACGVRPAEGGGWTWWARCGSQERVGHQDDRPDAIRCAEDALRDLLSAAGVRE